MNWTKWSARTAYPASKSKCVISHFLKAVYWASQFRCPSREDLPYIEAIFKETLRINPIAPLSLPYKSLEAHEYRGMFLSANFLRTSPHCHRHDHSKGLPNESIISRKPRFTGLTLLGLNCLGECLVNKNKHQISQSKLTLIDPFLEGPCRKTRIDTNFRKSLFLIAG